MKILESFDFNKLEFGLNSNSSFDPTNFTDSIRQSQIDENFEQSATPAFIMMLSLSVATFIAAFFQVQLILYEILIISKN